MPPRSSLSANDIITSIDKIQAKLNEPGFDLSSADPIIIDGIIRNLEIIGECVANLPDEAKQRHPSISWSKIRNFRNIAVHKYWDLDLETVEDICSNKLSELKRAAVLIAKEEGQTP